MDRRDLTSYILYALGAAFLVYGVWTGGWHRLLIAVAALVGVLVLYKRLDTDT